MKNLVSKKVGPHVKNDITEVINSNIFKHRGRRPRACTSLFSSYPIARSLLLKDIQNNDAMKDASENNGHLLNQEENQTEIQTEKENQIENQNANQMSKQNNEILNETSNIQKERNTILSTIFDQLSLIRQAIEQRYTSSLQNTMTTQQIHQQFHQQFQQFQDRQAQYFQLLSSQYAQHQQSFFAAMRDECRAFREDLIRRPFYIPTLSNMSSMSSMSNMYNSSNHSNQSLIPAAADLFNHSQQASFVNTPSISDMILNGVDPIFS